MFCRSSPNVAGSAARRSQQKLAKQVQELSEEREDMQERIELLELKKRQLSSQLEGTTVGPTCRSLLADNVFPARVETLQSEREARSLIRKEADRAFQAALEAGDSGAVDVSILHE